MPGFKEYLKHAYPYKRISFVKEEDLAVGASIVVCSSFLVFHLDSPKTCLLAVPDVCWLSFKAKHTNARPTAF